MPFFDIAAGFLIGSLTGMGVGGGGLFIIYLVMLCGVPQRTAQGANLVFFICAALSSLLIHARRRKINWRLAAAFSSLAIAGTLAGSYCSGIVPAQTLRQLFGLLLIVSGLISLMKTASQKKKTDVNDKKDRRKE